MMSWEKNVRKVVPYVAGEQPKNPNIIKLNTNECPYPPAPGVGAALHGFDCSILKRYPDPDAALLVEALARRHGLSPKQVFVGVGSDDVLAMAFMTFFQSGKPILFPDITYSFYKVWAELYRIPYECQRLGEDFRIVKEDYYKENGGVIFPNPNAPTGLYEELDLVEDILRKNQDVIVIVDEAYVDFAGRSAMELIDQYENLIVVQTFSKSRAMAGMRIGFCIGSEKLISCLNDVKFSVNSYTMSLPAQVLGAEALRDEDYFRSVTGKIILTRERIKRELAELGFSSTDSRANFIFASHESIPAEELFTALREAGIYVRYWKKPRIDNCLRITVGTDEQMDRLMEFLGTYVGKSRILDCTATIPEKIENGEVQ